MTLNPYSNKKEGFTSTRRKEGKSRLPIQVRKEQIERKRRMGGRLIGARGLKKKNVTLHSSGGEAFLRKRKAAEPFWDRGARGANRGGILNCDRTAEEGGQLEERKKKNGFSPPGLHGPRDGEGSRHFGHICAGQGGGEGTHSREKKGKNTFAPFSQRRRCKGKKSPKKGKRFIWDQQSEGTFVFIVRIASIGWNSQKGKRDAVALIQFIFSVGEGDDFR